jgi:hypothetical protein
MNLLYIIVFFMGCGLAFEGKAASFFNFKAQNIMQALWQLKVPAFECKLQEIMNQAEQHQKMIILNLNYCQSFMRQCKQLNNFFKHLYIDETDQSLIYSKHSLYFNQVKPLSSYWFDHKSAVGYQFYAQYFDAVARLFIVSVHEASRQESAAHYNDYKSRADLYYGELLMIMRSLEGFEFEHRYAKLLESYLELLVLVEQNKHTHIKMLK